MNKISKFFKFEEYKTTLSKEVLAGVTTFFAMVYIIFVNPNILTSVNLPIPLFAHMTTELPWGGVFLATIFATVIGTLIMALFANVPYSQAPGMGLNAFFTWTVCGAFGFQWQEALAMVFICGLINIVITVTKLRKAIIKAIPESLQLAIGGGIGLFIAYIGLLGSGVVVFDVVPRLSHFETMGPLLALIGIIVTVVLLLFKVRGAILIGIVATTLIGIPLGVTNFSNITFDVAGPFKDLGTTVFAALGPDGMGSLFSNVARIPVVLIAIFAFSLTDMFDTIGTFIGTGKRSGIFTPEEFTSIEEGKGFKTRMEKALFADAFATSAGALLGTSNVTTYIESTAGIEVGGKTGFTSLVTAFLFLMMVLISPIAGVIPGEATAPALVIVGIMMLSSFKGIKWDDFSEAVPAFFTSVVMALAYNISIGIALGFIFYILVKLIRKEAKGIHPVIWGSSGLFLLYFVLIALTEAGVI